MVMRHRNIVVVAVDLYKNLPGKSIPISGLQELPNLTELQRSAEQQHSVSYPDTAQEVKDVLWLTSGDKPPDPDGFSAQFCKDAWSIVGHDFSSAILDFLDTSKLPQRVSTTAITPVTKGQNASRMTNITCKCITKVLANR